MSEPVGIAQNQLRQIVQNLEAARFQLLGVRTTLPATPLELNDLLEDEPPDTSADIRTMIHCVLTDYLLPAIRDLRAAAGLGEENG